MIIWVINSLKKNFKIILLNLKNTFNKPLLKTCHIQRTVLYALGFIRRDKTWSLLWELIYVGQEKNSRKPEIAFLQPKYTEPLWPFKKEMRYLMLMYAFRENLFKWLKPKEKENVIQVNIQKNLALLWNEERKETRGNSQLKEKKSIKSSKLHSRKHRY